MSHKVALRFINLAHFFDHYFLLIFPTAALAIAPAWNMAYAEALLLATPLYVMFAIGTLPAGWLGDRCDRMKLMAVFFLGCGVSCLFIAMSAGAASLSFGLGLLGLFAALYHPVGLALVTDLGERTGRALAVNGVFGNMGLAGAAVLTGLIATQFGWRASFALPGVMSLTLGTVLLLRFNSSDDFRAPQNAATLHQEDATYQSTPHIVLTVILAAALFGGFVFNAVTISLPKFFDERLVSASDGLAWIGASTGIVFAIAAFAQLPVGELLDKYGARPILLCFLATQVLLLLCLSQADGLLALTFALLLVTVLFAEIPITTWLISRHIHSDQRSRVVSVEYVLSLGMTSAAVPLISWMHARGLGFDIQFVVLAASSGIVFAVAMLLPQAKKHAVRLS